MDFIFKKEHRKICYQIFKTSQDYKALCNLAEITATIDDNKYTVPKNELLLIQEGIEKDIIKIEDGKAFFTEEIYCIFFLALKNIEEFIDSFNDNIKFLKKLEDFRFRYSYKISSIFPEMIMVILDNLYFLPVFDKLINCAATLDEDKYHSLFNFITPTIPYLNIDNNKIIKFFDEINDKSKNKFLDNYNLFHSFHILGIEKPVQSLDLLESIKDKVYAAELLINLLTGLSKNKDYDFVKVHQRAIELISSENFINLRAAIIACAKLNYQNRENFKEKTYIRFTELAENKDQKILENITRGFNYFVNQEPRATEWLIHFSKSENKDILEEVSWSLTINNQKKDENWYKQILLNLTSIREHNDNISNALYFYINTDPEIVFKFLDKWLIESKENKGDLTNIFPIFPEIYNSQVKLLQKYITKWINSNSNSYIIHNYLSDIYRDLGIHKVSLEFDKEELNLLSDKDIEYLLIKTLGYVTYGKELLCSLIFSILHRDPESKSINLLVIDTFTNYIAYNFPGYSSEFLKIKISEGNNLEKIISQEIIRQMNEYKEKWDSLPEIKELEPSDLRIDYYSKIYNRYFQEIYKETEKNSSVSSIFPIDRTPVKGGNKFFFKMDGEYREKSSFTQITSSEELNKGDHIDPIGMENLRMHWRLYKRN